jgi:hypothetical protein
MYKSIILFFHLFGSVYLFTKSLEQINKLFLENIKIQKKLIVINGLSFVFSGSLFLYNIHTTFKNSNKKND